MPRLDGQSWSDKSSACAAITLFANVILIKAFHNLVRDDEVVLASLTIWSNPWIMKGRKEGSPLPAAGAEQAAYSSRLCLLHRARGPHRTNVTQSEQIPNVNECVELAHGGGVCALCVCVPTCLLTQLAKC